MFMLLDNNFEKKFKWMLCIAAVVLSHHLPLHHHRKSRSILHLMKSTFSLFSVIPNYNYVHFYAEWTNVFIPLTFVSPFPIQNLYIMLVLTLTDSSNMLGAHLGTLLYIFTGVPVPLSFICSSRSGTCQQFILNVVLFHIVPLHFAVTSWLCEV